MQNCVRFHAIESEIDHHKNLEVNEIAAPLTQLYAPKLHYF